MLKHSLSVFSALLPLTGDEKIPPNMVHASACIDPSLPAAREKQTTIRGTRTNQIRYLDDKEVSAVSFQVFYP
jgi:hypothetical protein